MPYAWQDTSQAADDAKGANSAEEQPLAELDLWPYQSLTPKGFVWFIVPTVVLFSLPLFAVLGSAVLWVLLAFMALAVCAVWAAIDANRRTRQTTEALTLWPDLLRVEHFPGQGQVKSWEANPYWVEVGLAETGGPVENYLTLRGAGRRVELGRFLTPAERASLKSELEFWLARTRHETPV